MLRWFHKRSKPLARGLIAALASLWLVAGAAPCVMAQPHQHGQPMDHAAHHHDAMHMDMAAMDGMGCDPVTAVSCQLPDVNSPLAATLGDLAAAPVLLALLPVSIIQPPARLYLRNDFFRPDIPAPPLHIRHLTLIL